MGLSAVPSREAVTVTAESDIEADMDMYKDQIVMSGIESHGQLSPHDDFGDMPKVKINKLGSRRQIEPSSMNDDISD